MLAEDLSFCHSALASAIESSDSSLSRYATLAWFLRSAGINNLQLKFPLQKILPDKRPFIEFKKEPVSFTEFIVIASQNFGWCETFTSNPLESKTKASAPFDFSYDTDGAELVPWLKSLADFRNVA